MLVLSEKSTNKTRAFWVPKTGALIGSGYSTRDGNTILKVGRSLGKYGLGGMPNRKFAIPKETKSKNFNA